MSLPIPLRAALYGGAALAGVALAARLLPVQISAEHAINSGASALDVGGLLSDVIHFKWNSAENRLSGAAGAAGADVRSSIEAGVKRQVLWGVAGGVLVAAGIDWVLS